MTWTVVWLLPAETRLAALWNTAPDRAAVARAADTIDAILKRDPYSQSESRTGPTRFMVVPPLAVLFDVSDADRLVTVWAVWRPH